MTFSHFIHHFVKDVKLYQISTSVPIQYCAITQILPNSDALEYCCGDEVAEVVNGQEKLKFFISVLKKIVYQFWVYLLSNKMIKNSKFQK